MYCRELVSALGEEQLDEAMVILASRDHDQHEVNYYCRNFILAHIIIQYKLQQLIGQDGCQHYIGQLRELQLYKHLF